MAIVRLVMVEMLHVLLRQHGLVMDLLHRFVKSEPMESKKALKVEMIITPLLAMAVTLVVLLKQPGRVTAQHLQCVRNVVLVFVKAPKHAMMVTLSVLMAEVVLELLKLAIHAPLPIPTSEH